MEENGVGRATYSARLLGIGEASGSWWTVWDLFRSVGLCPFAAPHGSRSQEGLEKKKGGKIHWRL